MPRLPDRVPLLCAPVKCSQGLCSLKPNTLTSQTPPPASAEVENNLLLMNLCEDAKDERQRIVRDHLMDAHAHGLPG